MKIWMKMWIAVLAVVLMMHMAPSVMAVDANRNADEIRMSVVTDYTDLELHLAMANSLRSYDYTMQSWAPLKKAVDTGNRYLQGKYGQIAVDEATVAIDVAMNNLVEMDYSQLEAVLSAVYQKIEENPQLHDVWVRLNATAEDARPLLTSGNQEAVNATVEKLTALLVELSECDTAAIPEPEIVLQEVEVEVYPTEDYCNIPMHRFWPVVCICSVVLNIALIAALLAVISKKRKTVDNTPLIHYDIEDDMDF